MSNFYIELNNKEIDLSVDRISELFGREIERIVGEVFASAVMNVKNDITKRKHFQSERILNASNEAKTIKIADQISNILQGFNGTLEGEATMEQKIQYLEGTKVVALSCIYNGNGDDFVDRVYIIFEETFDDLIKDFNI